jgi:hypothetical protein
VTPQWEHEQRCKLEGDYQDALDDFERSLVHLRGDPILAKERLDAAQEALDGWDEHVVQITPAPAGMVAVFERKDGLEEVIPVSYIGLQRSGRAVPYILLGNCEPKVPTRFSTFLRIDFSHLMGGEFALTEVGNEETERIPNGEPPWCSPQ